MSGAITLDYLKDILKVKSSYFKIKREQTRTLGLAGVKKKFDAKKTLEILEILLKKKKQKPTGFTTWQPPCISWMLRIIIALEPG